MIRLRIIKVLKSTIDCILSLGTLNEAIIEVFGEYSRQRLHDTVHYDAFRSRL